uniref:Uncharacterized protein n=1 Tax=Schistocephalus solidus TaxID=70667 RepID=A0A0X3NYY9_SCHSO
MFTVSSWQAAGRKLVQNRHFDVTDISGASDARFIILNPYISNFSNQKHFSISVNIACGKKSALSLDSANDIYFRFTAVSVGSLPTHHCLIRPAQFSCSQSC